MQFGVYISFLFFLIPLRPHATGDSRGDICFVKKAAIFKFFGADWTGMSDILLLLPIVDVGASVM